MDGNRKNQPDRNQLDGSLL